MNFQTHSGDWQDAACNFPDALQYDFDPTYIPSDDYGWIYSWEAVAVDMLIIAQRDGASAAVLHHGNPVLPPGMISLREIIRSIMREDCATEYLNTDECIECDEAFIASIRPLDMRRSVAS